MRFFFSKLVVEPTTPEVLRYPLAFSLSSPHETKKQTSGLDISSVGVHLNQASGKEGKTISGAQAPELLGSRLRAQSHWNDQ